MVTIQSLQLARDRADFLVSLASQFTGFKIPPCILNEYRSAANAEDAMRNITEPKHAAARRKTAHNLYVSAADGLERVLVAFFKRSGSFFGGRANRIGLVDADLQIAVRVLRKRIADIDAMAKQSVINLSSAAELYSEVSTRLSKIESDKRHRAEARAKAMLSVRSSEHTQELRKAA